ncbi:pseudaminic acid synthase [Bacteriovorax sp. Seq25_V]|uniref:pseudaminic acid synthase n=1 Tax=Bacteriovorax sp. Seq25_V TaxID=1201288 RepID=UPI00038A456E|nr:pseudaminic acid synthase [Bacteriovorax sp. Seq25_V]EQC43336.1 pseudaminic acid synthase [Bacteriovorax sp. Seq25_V]
MIFKINGTEISDLSPAYIIAEMSGNHNGDINYAIEIIKKAKEAGADAVKLQTYKASTITLDSNKEDFLLPKDSPWAGSKNLYSLYEEAHTPWEWHKKLFKVAHEVGIDIFSSPFDETAVDLLESLNTPAYKIASPEINDLQLIKKVALTNKPIILSTGLATVEDIELAIKTLEDNGCYQYAFLKCTTAYPAPLDEINLATIPEIRKRYNCIAGLSDHTLGIEVPIASVALGAKIIEKHFTVDKSNTGVDSFFSLDFVEFKQMVSSIRKVESAIGVANFDLTKSSKNNLRGKRSLYVSKNIKKGELLTPNNIKSVRPGLGLAPKYFDSVLNKPVKRDLEFGERLKLEDIDIDIE